MDQVDRRKSHGPKTSALKLTSCYDLPAQRSAVQSVSQSVFVCWISPPGFLTAVEFDAHTQYLNGRKEQEIYTRHCCCCCCCCFFCCLRCRLEQDAFFPLAISFCDESWYDHIRFPLFILHLYHAACLHVVIINSHLRRRARLGGWQSVLQRPVAEGEGTDPDRLQNRRIPMATITVTTFYSLVINYLKFISSIFGRIPQRTL